MLKKVTVLALAGVSFGLGGCATVLNGTDVDYSMDSRPASASATLISGQTCVTPCEIELRRKEDTRVDIALPGYKPVYVLVQSKLAGSTFGNILLGGGIGAVVDGSNGASNRLYPHPLVVRLAREGTNEEPVLLDKDGKEIMTVKAHNDSVREDVAKTIGSTRAGMDPGSPGY